MPEFNEVLVRKPVIFSGGGLFTFTSTIDPTVSTSVAGSYAVHGDNRRRGVAYTQKDFVGSFGTTSIILSRQSQFVSTGPDFTHQFNAEFDVATPTNVFNRTTYHLIDGIFWVLGSNFVPLVYAKADSSSLTTSSGWVDRSSELSTFAGNAQFMRKASAAGFLYYIVQNNFAGGNPFLVFRGAASTAPNVAFTSITTSPALPGSGSLLTAYDVSSDGQTHIFSCDLNTVYRSADGGVSFSTISPGITPNEIVYSPFYNRWVMCSSGGLVRYSDNGGVAWSVPTRLETNPRNAGSFQTFATTYHIEKLDPDGRYLIMTSNYAPIHIHISEDGGKTWAFLQQVMSPSYDTSQVPRNGATTTGQLALVKTATKILIYQGGTSNSDELYGWNFDNGVFASGPIDFPL